MKKLVLAILFPALMPTFLLAQKNYRGSEFGLFLGGSYYLGDLNRNGHFNSFTKPAGGIIYRYNFNPRLSFKANMLFGTLFADDARSGVPAQEQRNLHFKSPLTELAGEIEFNFMNYVIGSHRTLFTPYVFVGIAGFKFNPKAQVDGNWFALQPLSTEGQETTFNGQKRYKLNQLAIPFGVGVKAWISSRVGLALEWGWRKTFTDYLDDVSTTYVDPVRLGVERGPVASYFSDTGTMAGTGINVGKQRGDPSDKDWFSFAGVSLMFKLRNRYQSCNSYK